MGLGGILNLENCFFYIIEYPSPAISASSLMVEDATPATDVCVRWLETSHHDQCRRSGNQRCCFVDWCWQSDHQRYHPDGDRRQSSRWSHRFDYQFQRSGHQTSSTSSFGFEPSILVVCLKILFVIPNTRKYYIENVLHVKNFTFG